jgi:hypothetical protein
MMVSWYSTERTSSTSSSIGILERNRDSEHPVHSQNAARPPAAAAGAANTSATLGTKDDDSPMVAVSAVQYFMKSLRETPFSFNLS